MKQVSLSKRKGFFYTIGTITPAVLLGMIGMLSNDIPITISLQNVVALFIFGLLAFFLIHKGVNIKDEIIIVMSLVLLLMTLFGNGIDGVHRWIELGVININAAMVVLPITLVAVYNMLYKKANLAIIIIVLTAILLFSQPDASQLMGFSIPIIILLFDRNIKLNNGLKYAVSLFLIILMALSWVYIDNLAPVSYVEGILGLLKDISILLSVMGIILLALIPLPFILFPPKEFKLLSISIGIYFILIIISSFLGNFPVPFMGYGLSSIAGYCLVLTWYLNRNA